MTSEKKDRQNHEVDPHRPALTLIRRVRELALGKLLWPGFDPADIPFALYDGAQTFLFGCETTPAGFQPIEGDGFSYLIYDGRHPNIVANTCIDLEGVLVATLMTDQDSLRRDLDPLASIAIHEMFHVFQFQDRQKWVPANEADRFLYPLSDAGLLKLRRAEIAALHRAVESEQMSEKIGWASYALQIRRERFAQMAAPFSEYERRTEIIEGLASYVEARSIDRRDVDLSKDGYRPDQLRPSCYKVGHAFALLLDETSPDWKHRFEREPTPPLDECLGEALVAFQGDVVEKHFSRAELEHFKNLSEQDVTQMASERSDREHDFRNRPGQRIVVEADDAAPLQTGMFDPYNVFLLDRDVIHTRLLQLQSGDHTIRMLRESTDIVALTESAGSHPLFSGIRRVEFVVEGEVSCMENAGVVTISGGGLEAQLGGVLRLNKGRMVITLGQDMQAPA